MADEDRREAVRDATRSPVAGLSPRGRVPELLLHIQGDEAWSRGSDEPFGGDRVRARNASAGPPHRRVSR